MSKNLLNVFSDESAVSLEDLVLVKMGVKKSTGERFAKAVTKDGKTFIKTLSESGIEQDSITIIPCYSSKKERDKIIKDLSKKYTQEDIADMLGISQGTVSNSLSKKKNNKKK